MSSSAISSQWERYAVKRCYGPSAVRRGSTAAQLRNRRKVLGEFRAVLYGHPGELYPRVDIELPKNMAHVGIHGVMGREDLFPHLTVREAFPFQFLQAGQVGPKRFPCRVAEVARPE